jgi:lambda repressor-like predicted transcriptional regulator
VASTDDSEQEPPTALDPLRPFLHELAQSNSLSAIVQRVWGTQEQVAASATSSPENVVPSSRGKRGPKASWERKAEFVAFLRRAVTTARNNGKGWRRRRIPLAALARQEGYHPSTIRAAAARFRVDLDSELGALENNSQ